MMAKRKRPAGGAVRRIARPRSAGGLLALTAAVLSLQAASAAPLDQASMVVFSPEGAWEISLTPQAGQAPPLVMTVFSTEGAKEIPLTQKGGQDRDRPQTQARQAKKQLGMSVGYRQDTLDWNIAGNAFGQNPDVLSELEWKLKMLEIRLDGQWQAANGFTVMGDIAYAYAFSGEDRDSDYSMDGRQGEFSRSYSESHGSYATDIALGLGWTLDISPRLTFTPALGYAWSHHVMRSRHGKRHIPYVARFSGLDSTYKPEWHGPWLGLEAKLQATERLEFHAGTRREWLDYKGEGNWNLRSDFAHPVSFRDTGRGKGWQSSLGASWRLQSQDSLSLDFRHQSRSLKNGDSWTFFANGDRDITRFNEANWESWSANIGYRLDF
ncbi:MAG: autotransporter domain-containing protein [Zoogloeaceae bacterium]|jgi:hypothetical protein|nr:autotransporter domain-containing protein [Zoogloeaceae bacterium]